jgi:hypothetical protein
MERNKNIIKNHCAKPGCMMYAADSLDFSGSERCCNAQPITPYFPLFAIG